MLAFFYSVYIFNDSFLKLVDICKIRYQIIVGEEKNIFLSTFLNSLARPCKLDWQKIDEQEKNKFIDVHPALKWEDPVMSISKEDTCGV